MTDELILALLPALAAAADDPTTAETGPQRALDRLREAGLLTAVLPRAEGGEGLGTDAGTALATATLLRRLGRADLSLGRLFEGHMNAVKLVALHGTDTQRGRVFAAVRDGALMGVWGADDGPPVTIGDGVLNGSKRYASGLGAVALAVVTARDAAGGRMVLVDATDPARQDAGRWTASAMRATRSGAFRLSGLPAGPAEVVGAPDALGTEPWFEGGIWRYCAVHVGGAEAVVQATLDALRAAGRADDPHQAMRVGRATATLEAARRMVDAAALTVETCDPADPAAVDLAVAHALLTRAVVEDACLLALDLCERALGMAAHDGAARIDRLRRDLSLFLRQAAPDGKMMRAVATLAASDSPTGERWG